MTPVKEIIGLGLNLHCLDTESNKDGMTVCVQAFASQQRTVRCHDTEISATEINRSHKNGAFSELA